MQHIPQSAVPMNAMYFHSHRAYFCQFSCAVGGFFLRSSFAAFGFAKERQVGGITHYCGSGKKYKQCCGKR